MDPESLELLKLIMKQQERISTEIVDIKESLYGNSSCAGLDTSLALIEKEVLELKQLENDLGTRIYEAVAMGFCKAISDWCQNHVAESIASFLGFITLLLMT